MSQNTKSLSLGTSATKTKSPYFDQTALLLYLLEQIDLPDNSALKGGTAINFFLNDMPRFSVDADLVYLPVKPREESLSAINNIMDRIEQRLRQMPDMSIQVIKNKDGTARQINILRDAVEVKFEINHILRGTVYPNEKSELSALAKRTFNRDITLIRTSDEDLYAGKFCAALSRQHPRDLFDVHIFLERYPFTEKLKKAFLVYLISHNDPIRDVLFPKIKDQQITYEGEFQGMTSIEIPYSVLKESLKKLINLIHQNLTADDKLFLLSLKAGDPNWSLLGVEHAPTLPAVLIFRK